MKRRTLDKIISIVSLGFAALLFLFAGLLTGVQHLLSRMWHLS